MGNFGRDDSRNKGFSRGGFSRGGDRGGFRDRGRSSFGGNRGGFARDANRGPREMFKTTCSNCGKECEVPFRPTNGKPVYCSDCFEKMGNVTRTSDRRESGSEFRPQPQAQSTPNNTQLEAISIKLDKIISLLETPTETPKSGVKIKRIAKKVISKK